MWPFSSSSSRVTDVPTQPKIHIDLESFATNEKTLDATLTSDIWAMVEWLSATTNTTHIDVIRALLFQALYGRIAYEQLIAHVRKQRNNSNKYKWDGPIDLFSRDKSQNQQTQIVTVATRLDNEILQSPARGTPADLKHVGKSNIRRKLEIPHRMWIDLDRQAAKAGMDLSPYVRGLLFKVLQGEVNYNQWQHARAELENQPKHRPQSY